jgi:hypothetical protein
MKWKDIKTTFKDQWVLIEVEKVDETFNVVEGEVLAHSKDKNEVYQKLLQVRPKEFSIEYTGDIPEDLGIVMVTVNENTSLNVFSLHPVPNNQFNPQRETPCF